ncbi:MAG: asparaginase domain-containing protein [Methylococcaceae bacterium]|nr:asparaginase domain-containing protein [Methylococcaceae bacterium]
MKNILVVFTGGTIGSTTSNNTISIDGKQNYKLLDLFKKSYSDSANLDFKPIQPIQLLSENLFPSAWEVIIKAIEAEYTGDLNGIIVTHGTDTLAFTASALSLYFHSIKIPLLLVSSDYPLDCPQANGLINFNCAVEFIKQRPEPGVFVPYKNQNETTQLHLGTRIASCLQLSGNFISVQYKAFLSFSDNIFYQTNAITSTKDQIKQLVPTFSSRILLIKPYPGLDYSHYNLDQVDVVLHDLYHSGTACSTTEWGESHSLVKFIKKCHQINIPLYMAPAIKSQEAYDSTKILLKYGAKMIWNISLESAYAKLSLAYGNFTHSDSINQFLEQNIAFEQIET